MPKTHRRTAQKTSSFNIDNAELETAGYQRSMPRQFPIFSLLPLGFALTCSWLGMGSSLGIALTEASSAGAIWSLLIAGLFATVLAAGISELASAYPIAGVQYHWSFMASSEEWAPFAAFVNGWMSVFAWWLDCSAVANLIARMILAMATLWYPDYAMQNWHQYLMYVAIVWFAAGVNIIGSQPLSLLNKCVLFLSIITLLATFIALLACSSGQYQPAGWIFGDTTNSTGWSCDGFAFVLAIMNGVFCSLGMDCGAHLAEEIPNPGKSVPHVIMWQILLDFLTSWPFAIVLVATITSVSDVLSGDVTGFPLLTVYYQATGSKAGATVLLTFFTLCFVGCVIACFATCSRTLWVVSRDGALPFSQYWQVIHRYQMPVKANVLSATVMSLYRLIFLGSANVFSSMINAAIIFCQTSIVIPQAIVLYRGREQVLPPRYFAIPEPWGKIVNSVAIAWVVFVNVLVCFPVSYLVTLENMNWISVVSTGLVAFIFLLWFTSK